MKYEDDLGVESGRIRDLFPLRRVDCVQVLTVLLLPGVLSAKTSPWVAIRRSKRQGL